MECPACHHSNIDGARFCAKCGAPLPTVISDHDPLIGAIVGGRYRITGILGEGGMGRVYTAEQQMGTTVRKVAVKTLLAQHAKDPQVLARFMRECGTVAELEHPNTIKVYDFGQTDSGELYIAMELLNGTSLEDALAKSGPMAPERVDRILAHVCGSLQEAHDKGIVHRDLKPANIFLTRRAGEEDYVKVLDFGIAKRAERPDSKEQKLTQQGTVLGTPPYMSPEQFRGQELDARSDIYSLGVVVYEMLTGRLPFDADNPWAWATQHLTAQPTPFEVTPIGAQIPPKMKAAILRALEKDKAKRQASVREFHEDLTVGAPRASIFAGSSGPYSHAGGATSHMQGYPSMHGTPMPSGAISARPGGTQVGEPLFTPSQGGQPQAPAGRTMLDSGPRHAVGTTPGPMPVMPHVSVPTGGGQAFPAPPPASASRPKNKSIVPIVAGAGALGVIGIIALVVTSKSSTNTDPPPITLSSAGPSEVKVASDPPITAGSSQATSPTATPSTQPNTGGGVTGQTGTTGAGNSTSTGGATKPAVDPAAAAACEAAITLATGSNTLLAISKYRACAGPRQGAARAAIDASAQREVAAKGCRAKDVAEAAASVGAGSAKKNLPAKCR
jgi:eukaryotic-like serine/threonine-protein kinase